MTKHFRAALLSAVVSLSLLTGCAASAVDESPRTQPRQTTPSAQSAPAESVRQLTAEEAQAIALHHAGFTADQVLFVRTEPELWDRIPHYDVEFQEGRWEYEYEIHAETGVILSFEKDD